MPLSFTVVQNAFMSEIMIAIESCIVLSSFLIAYRYMQILQYHMDHNEYVHVMEACKKFG